VAAIFDQAFLQVVPARCVLQVVGRFFLRSAGAGQAGLCARLGSEDRRQCACVSLHADSFLELQVQGRRVCARDLEVKIVVNVHVLACMPTLS